MPEDEPSPCDGRRHWGSSSAMLFNCASLSRTEGGFSSVRRALDDCPPVCCDPDVGEPACGCDSLSRHDGPSDIFFELMKRGRARAPSSSFLLSKGSSRGAALALPPSRQDRSGSSRCPPLLSRQDGGSLSSRGGPRGSRQDRSFSSRGSFFSAFAAPRRPWPNFSQGSSFLGALSLSGGFSRRRPSAAHSAFSFSETFIPADSRFLFLSQGGVTARSFLTTTVPASASTLARASFSCTVSRRCPLCCLKRCSSDCSSV
mmetsp:Transcript_62659/g.136069  ORF Transcript_62659/g.136069 Transcript_62659/m.136069 type:complete len:259 (-) Transcript_62659:1164-1940(-)